MLEALFAGLLPLVGIADHYGGVAFVRQQLGGDFGARVDHQRVDQKAFAHPVQQGIAERWLARLATKGAVGIEQQAALGLSRVFGGGLGGVELLDVVLGRSSKAQFVANEVLEHRARIAANGAVRFVGDNQVKVRRRELLVLVPVEQALHRGDNNLGLAPVAPVFFVDGGLVVVLEQEDESLVGLVLQFQTVHQKEHTPGIAGAQK